MFPFVSRQFADSSLVRLDYAWLSQQALVEMVIDGIEEVTMRKSVEIMMNGSTLTAGKKSDLKRVKPFRWI